MEYKKRKHNTPIATVIKNYLDKGGGKVSVSRNEIEWRFNALDWRYQKQILFAFLQSGPSDRKWAYKKLYSIWDDCFIPVLQELWEQYHELQLSWLVINFFPVDYLKKNMDILSKDRNYYFLYLRLCNDCDFVLDRARLNETDLLAVKFKLREIRTDSDVKDLFFLLIYKLCKGVYGYGVWKKVNYKADQSILAIFGNSRILNMLHLIKYELKRPYLVEKIQDWMHLVTDRYRDKYGNTEPFLYYGGDDSFRDTMIQHCLEYIAPEYTEVWNKFDPNDQHQFLADIEKRHRNNVLLEDPENIERYEFEAEFLENDSVRKLYESFDLETENSELPF